ncbi:uncharacterized protein LOC121408737 [Lytechinus variegatus]|uniref:uncharacterized protein LOC121408737 n=1 Tax=Lytechinus variegatus TaxID=7654 RepID=UPI001BB2CBC6|nr:uncharacterized protein LOC121408737 [Lytechinus variegatus]
MAEELISTPKLTDNGLDNCVTPESWEMRPEAITPGKHLQILTSNDQAETTPCTGNDGGSYSFSGFMDFDMYETPPGAQLYRDQCTDDILCMSYQEMDTPSKADVAPPESRAGTPDDMVNLPENPPLQADTEEGYFAYKGTQNNMEIALTRGEPSLEAYEEGGYSPSRDVQDNTDIALNGEVQNGEYETENNAEKKYIKLGDSGLQSSLNEDEIDSQQLKQHEVEECILERLDQQNYPEQEDEVGEITPIALPVVNHQPFKNEPQPSPKVESLHGSDLLNGNSSPAFIDSQAAEVSHSEETTECRTEYLNCLTRKDTEDSKVECQGEPEVPLKSSPFLSENTISSLISMGVPRDADEMDQLADFLNMDDPFTETVASPTSADLCTVQSSDITSEEMNSVPMDVEKIVSPPAPSKRKRRRKKVVTVTERRRSVRIARRESLLNTPSDVGLAKDTSGILPTYDQKIIRESVIGNFHQDHKDQNESQDVIHQEMGESSSALNCMEINTLDSRPMMEPITVKEPEDAKELGHLKIDLPMTQKRKKKANNGRRRSVRLLKQDKDNEDDNNEAVAKMPVVDKEETKCDSVFLANFADFGLGDDWMPGEMFGESQFAKTPRDKSSRRKSARLSGVHIPLLELKNKSEVKVYGVDQASYTDVPDVSMGNSHVPDPALTLLSTPPPMISVSQQFQDSVESNNENITEDSLQKQDAIKPSKRKKKGSCSKRRRSIRLIKKPEEEPRCVTEYEQENWNAAPIKKAATNYKRKESAPDKVLQEVKVTSCDNIFQEPMIEEELFTGLKPHVDDVPMDLDDCYGETLEVMDFQEVVVKPNVKKDTPFMGRKRVSRISEKDKEIDDAIAQEQSCPKERTAAEKQGDPEQDHQQPPEDIAEGIEGSSDNNFKVSNKVKSLYLKKGAAGTKKHNLETIFESPKKRATGTPVNLLGKKKLKRSVVFTETPWLGRTGRTKGRKVKKGKQVKRVLSSTVEKSWKLDLRLSDLDILSI